MNKTIFALIAVAGLAGCTDAERAAFGALGEESQVVCYSGGQPVFSQTSTGKVVQLEGSDGLVFKSKETGGYVRAFADCIVTTK